MRSILVENPAAFFHLDASGPITETEAVAAAV
jgi:hypothetical protein